MKRSLKVWMLAAALTMAGGYAMAQANPPKEEGSKPGMHGMHGMDHAKMAERMKRHMQHLKAELKLSAEQESAWTTFATGMTPPARRPVTDHAKIEKLGMPERLDKMKEMHQKRHDMHMAEMEKRHAVVKTFYAVLTPDQKKVFDAKAQPKWPHGPQHG
jgi:Spy/CpxP family protein refolding chaperone